MIHIEFSGVPGSGKTHLCTRVADELRRQGFQVVTNPMELANEQFLFRAVKKIGTVLIQILFHPVWTSYVLYIILSTHQSSFKGMLRSFFTIAQVSGIVRKHTHSDACLLLDQGSVQAFFSLLYDSASIPGICPERILPLPDILLETDGPDAILLSRLESRTRSQSRVESDGIRGIQRSRNILDQIRKSSMYRKIPVTIPVSDDRNDTTPAELARKIRESILDGKDNQT